MFWGDVLGGAVDFSDHAEIGVGLFAGSLGDAEVEKFDDFFVGFAVVKIDVFGFEVAVDEAAFVDGAQACKHLKDDGDGGFGGEPSLVHAFKEFFAAEHFHGEEGVFVFGFAEFVDTCDVGGANGAADLSFSFESLGDGPVVEVFGCDDFERDGSEAFSVGHESFGAVDFTHAAGGDEAEDAVGAETRSGEQEALDDFFVGDL